MASSEAKSGEVKFDYDLAVIGGGSGGLAAAKEAAKKGVKVVCFDYVKPTPHGTTWGLGGTCVNVGCIPKKLMHYSGLCRKAVDDAKELGWKFSGDPQLDWKTAVTQVDNYIKGLNFGYRTQLRENKVNYINAYASLTGKNTCQYTDPKTKKVVTVNARFILLAVGGRPKYPDNTPGAKEFGLTSDDIFWWKKTPGKTLVVGASYIALETAGFLNEMGFDTTVMVRSILLRGFDQQISNIIGEIMEVGGVRFVRPATVLRLDKKAPSADKPATAASEGKITVTYKMEDTKQELKEEFDTVIFAMGREPQVKELGLEKVGITTDVKGDGKIFVDDDEQTNVPGIYAIGDCIVGRPELTPVAIQAGILLARRLFAGAKQRMDYINIPTTVFTPVEYGCCGYSEEAAVAKFGKDKIETYISRFGALETVATHPMPKHSIKSYHFHKKPDENGENTEEKSLQQQNVAKLVVDKTQNDRVIGFHYFGQNAGEVTQGFALALKLGATKSDFDSLVGIHPTCAEEFTILKITGSSGEDIHKKDGC